MSVQPLHDALVCDLYDDGRAYCPGCQWEDEWHRARAIQPRPVESPLLTDAKRIAATMQAHPDIYRDAILSMLAAPMLDLLQEFTQGANGGGA